MLRELASLALDGLITVVVVIAWGVIRLTEWVFSIREDDEGGD